MRNPTPRRLLPFFSPISYEVPPLPLPLCYFCLSVITLILPFSHSFRASSLFFSLLMAFPQVLHILLLLLFSYEVPPPAPVLHLSTSSSSSHSCSTSPLPTPPSSNTFRKWLVFFWFFSGFFLVFFLRLPVTPLLC